MDNLIESIRLELEIRKNHQKLTITALHKMCRHFIRYVDTFVTFSGDNNNRYFPFSQQGLFGRTRICGKVPISSGSKKVRY